ncbi:MAG TPA: hypothetical protein VFQ60_01455 [Patescibacteria group bacterium]|nr:hypothetical protein [Patescibacteria group bacterium]
MKEGSDIVENAKRKARAYAGKTDVPILGLDSAFVIEGESLDPARVRRNALEGRDESSMAQNEIAEAMFQFYQNIAKKHGGRVPAYWEDASALALPDGELRIEVSRRPVILTAEPHGEINPLFPVRCLYIDAASGKYAVDQTQEDHKKEMQPYKEALVRLLRL